MTLKPFSDVQATILIDVTKPREKLLENLHKDARWGVKKSQKENLVVEQTENKKDIEKFYEIYKDTCKHGGILPKPLEEIKNKNPVFFVCKKSNKIIAGAVALIHKNKTELFLNASLHEFQKYQPNNALYWHLIVWTKQKKFKFFDLGGFQLNAKQGDKLYNINKFKQRWGGELKIYKIYSYNPLYIFGRKIIRNSRFAKRVWDKLKGRGRK